MNLIVDLQYFPSVIFYKNVGKFSDIVFEQYEYYQKMSFRNRCQITGAGGLINLSVPLEKGRDQKTLLKDVRISDRGDWQAQHWKTILSCYSRSPWFEFYRDELNGLYRKPFHFLLDWNLTCFEWSLKVLQIAVPFALTGEYHKNYEEGNWTDWRGKLLPKNRTGTVNPDPTSGTVQGSDVVHPEPTGRIQQPGVSHTGPVDNIQQSGMARPTPTDSLPTLNHLHPTQSGSTQEPGTSHPDPAGSHREPADTMPEAPVKYRQVFEERIGFLPNLSILDLLFCEGKNARVLLK